MVLLTYQHTIKQNIIAIPDRDWNSDFIKNASVILIGYK